MELGGERSTKRRGGGGTGGEANMKGRSLAGGKRTSYLTKCKNPPPIDFKGRKNFEEPESKT